MEEPLILITGANGQLGREFRRLSEAWPKFRFLFANKLELDVTVESWVKDYIAKHKPSAVVNCAAYTNVERAEDEPEPAHLGNALSAGFLAEACHINESLLVHISTDYVFDGKKNVPYLETDAVIPLNIYGQSKLDGERLVDEKTERHFTIRTSWLYSSYGHNFYKTMLRLAKERGELNVVNDQYASPTYAGDLATAILQLLEKVIIQQIHIDPGLYHYTQEGIASWFDFASEIMKQANMNIPVHPVFSGAFPVKAIRPAYSKLDTSKWINNTGIVPATWQEGLLHCRINENNTK